MTLVILIYQSHFWADYEGGFDVIKPLKKSVNWLKLLGHVKIMLLEFLGRNPSPFKAPTIHLQEFSRIAKLALSYYIEIVLSNSILHKVITLSTT